jgi:hypothetical protein
VVVHVRCGTALAGARAVRAGARRLVRPGERLDLGPASLEVVSRDAGATRVLACDLLAGASADAGPLVGPRLVVVEGPDAGARLSLRDGAVVGRGAGADLRLRDHRASRRHARFSLSGEGSAAVRDLGSKNGVAVNGRRVRRGAAPVAPGDLVAVGDTLLAFEDGLARAKLPAPLSRRHGSRTVPARKERAQRPPARAAAQTIALALGALLAAIALCLAAAL